MEICELEEMLKLLRKYNVASFVGNDITVAFNPLVAYQDDLKDNEAKSLTDNDYLFYGVGQ